MKLPLQIQEQQGKRAYPSQKLLRWGGGGIEAFFALGADAKAPSLPLACSSAEPTFNISSFLRTLNSGDLSEFLKEGGGVDLYSGLHVKSQTNPIFLSSPLRTEPL